MPSLEHMLKNYRLPIVRIVAVTVALIAILVLVILISTGFFDADDPDPDDIESYIDYDAEGNLELLTGEPFGGYEGELRGRVTLLGVFVDPEGVRSAAVETDKGVCSAVNGAMLGDFKVTRLDEIGLTIVSGDYSYDLTLDSPMINIDIPKPESEEESGGE